MENKIFFNLIRILELKNTLTEIMNHIDEFNSKSDTYF